MTTSNLQAPLLETGAAIEPQRSWDTYLNGPARQTSVASSAPSLHDDGCPRGRASRAFTAGSVATLESMMSVMPEYETSFPPMFFWPGPRLWAVLFLLGAFMGSCLTVLKQPLDDVGISSSTFLCYISIPIVSTVFTYVHIWAALYMTFYPLQYMGCLQIPDTNTGCGWQGIVPSKVRKMARTAVDLMTSKLITVQEVFEKIDPVKVADELDVVLHKTLCDIVHEVASLEEPELWALLPEAVKEELIEKAREQSPPVIAAMMHAVKTDITSVFDLTHMVETAFVREPGLLNHMFIKCGYNELVFIRDCGAYMGAGVGIFQMLLWMRWSEGWMLPAFGLVVGCLSNWIALKMIFEPVEPIPLFNGRVVLQGLFLKRQRAVSAEYSKIVAEHVLAGKYLIPAIITGPKADNLFDIIRSHIQTACDKYCGPTKPIITTFRGKDKYNHSKLLFGDRLMACIPETVIHVERYVDTAMDLENLLRRKMSKLPSRDFEQLLHPVFQEDEWKLVLMGGVLGVIVGLLQWHVLGG